MNQQTKIKIRRLAALIIIFYIFFGLISAFFLIKAIKSTQKVIGAVKLQDLDATKAYLKDAKSDFKNAQRAQIAFTPLRIIPLFGWYIADVGRLTAAGTYGLSAAESLAEAVTPYADVLGLKGQGTFLGGTAQERLSLAIQTLSKVSPQLDKINADLQKASRQVADIATWRYPNFLPKKPGEKVQTAKDTFYQIDKLLTETKPLIEVFPQIMGLDDEKRYLILFQNDAELRPTGGFITAYGYFKVKNGLIESEGSSDIYKLDDSLTKRIPAPNIILKYLPNVPNLNLRDSNLSPDYLVSMKQFEELYQNTTANQDIDGIITLDTQFVLDMIGVLGPIEAYNTKFTADKVEECDCPHIIYELEKYADQPVAFERGDRKGILGVLMQQMMTSTFNAPKSRWPKLIGTVLESLRKKHLLLYFKDTKAQAAAERINFAGRVYQYDGDYFYINETNFAGAKSNLYIQEKVKQQIKLEKEGKITKKVTIEYKYPRRGDNCSLERKGGLCLAGLYRDFIRVYVPKGASLVKSQGAEQGLTEAHDLEKTVFEGFLTIRPEGTTKIEFEYTIPQNSKDEYKLLIQKQPGTPNHTYEIEAFGKKQKPFALDADKEIIIKI